MGGHLVHWSTQYTNLDENPPFFVLIPTAFKVFFEKSHRKFSDTNEESSPAMNFFVLSKSPQSTIALEWVDSLLFEMEEKIFKYLEVSDRVCRLQLQQTRNLVLVLKNMSTKGKQRSYSLSHLYNYLFILQPFDRTIDEVFMRMSMPNNQNFYHLFLNILR